MLRLPPLMCERASVRACERACERACVRARLHPHRTTIAQRYKQPHHSHGQVHGPSMSRGRHRKRSIATLLRSQGNSACGHAGGVTDTGGTAWPGDTHEPRYVQLTLSLHAKQFSGRVRHVETRYTRFGKSLCSTACC